MPLSISYKRRDQFLQENKDSFLKSDQKFMKGQICKTGVFKKSFNQINFSKILSFNLS